VYREEKERWRKKQSVGQGGERDSRTLEVYQLDGTTATCRNGKTKRERQDTWGQTAGHGDVDDHVFVHTWCNKVLDRHGMLVDCHGGGLVLPGVKIATDRNSTSSDSTRRQAIGDGHVAAEAEVDVVKHE